MNSHETIDKFLNGELTPEETTRFLETVEHDQELRSLLESDRVINSVFNKEKTNLLHHDLSGVAGTFVAGLAATGAIANAGLITAAYAKKAGMSWITLIASSALSISVCAGAYWYMTNQSMSELRNPQLSVKHLNEIPPTTISLPVPSIVRDEAPIVLKKPKSISKGYSSSSPIVNNIESKPTDIPQKKVLLEHSSSRYRPKIQD